MAAVSHTHTLGRAHQRLQLTKVQRKDAMGITSGSCLWMQRVSYTSDGHARVRLTTGESRPCIPRDHRQETTAGLTWVTTSTRTNIFLFISFPLEGNNPFPDINSCPAFCAKPLSHGTKTPRLCRADVGLSHTKGLWWHFAKAPASDLGHLPGQQRTRRSPPLR